MQSPPYKLEFARPEGDPNHVWLLIDPRPPVLYWRGKATLNPTDVERERIADTIRELSSSGWPELEPKLEAFVVEASR